MAGIKQIKVPFDKDGNMLHKDWNGWQVARYVDYDTTPFHGRFTFVSIDRFSSNVATFEDGMGRTYYMNQTEFVKNIPFMVHGVLDGAFHFKKQGKYFSLAYIEDANPII